MRTVNELEDLLFNELKITSQNKEELISSSQYFNEFSGKSSIYFTSLLYEKLVKFDDWDKKNWLDDCLITKIEFNNNKYSIWAVVISGKQGTTKQWTDPAYFEIKTSNDKSKFVEYTFLFVDKNDVSMSYKEYSNNRTYWDKDFYKDDNWNPTERDWDYIINVKKPIVNLGSVPN